MYADIYGLPERIFDKRKGFNTVYAFVNPENDADFAPRDLDGLLAQFGPGNGFIDFDSENIVIDDPNGILYRFEVKKDKVREAYGDYPAATK